MKFFRFKDNKHKEKWAQTRDKGFIRFFVVKGLFTLGGIFTVGTILLETILRYILYGDRLYSESFLLVKCLGGLLYGSLMGLIHWFGSEWAYKKSEAELKES